MLTAEFWQGTLCSPIALCSLISVEATWFGIVANLHILGAGSDLGRPQFMHVPLMVPIITRLHGLTASALLMQTGIKTGNFSGHLQTMMVSDFFDSLICWCACG